jgi:hypothetical protein
MGAAGRRTRYRQPDDIGPSVSRADQNGIHAHLLGPRQKERHFVVPVAMQHPEQVRIGADSPIGWSRHNEVTIWSMI